MKWLILSLLISISLNADILKQAQLEKIEKEKQKSSLESNLLENSWINPLSIEVDYIKSKNENIKSTSKKAYLNFNQDIFKSGGIFYTIEKAKKQKKLSIENYKNSLDIKKTEALKLVLNIQKIDLQIKKQDYLIKNKKIEIDKKEEEYLNGTTSIEEFDTAVIEKNDLENQIEDLKISKYNLIKELKTYSSISYTQIKPVELKLVNLEEFLKKNRTFVINKLNSSIAKYEQDIISSKYLPKVSISSQFGYENNDEKDNDFYNYGIKITIPLDYNMNKEKEISKLNYKLSEIEDNLIQEKEKNSYDSTFQSLKHVDKKIDNGKSTIKKYEAVYRLTKDLVEGLLKTKEDLKTIENRLNSSRLDIDILNIEKQLLIYDINRNSKIRKYY